MQSLRIAPCSQCWPLCVPWTSRALPAVIPGSACFLGQGFAPEPYCSQVQPRAWVFTIVVIQGFGLMSLGTRIGSPCPCCQANRPWRDPLRDIQALVSAEQGSMSVTGLNVQLLCPLGTGFNPLVLPTARFMQTLTSGRLVTWIFASQ